MHFKAEMFGFRSEYFVYRKLRRAPEKLSFRFKCPDTGTVRILGNCISVVPENLKAKVYAKLGGGGRLIKALEHKDRWVIIQ